MTQTSVKSSAAFSHAKNFHLDSGMKRSYALLSIVLSMSRQHLVSVYIWVQGGVYVLGKACASRRLHPVSESQKFPQPCLSNGSSVSLMKALPCASREMLQCFLFVCLSSPVIDSLSPWLHSSSVALRLQKPQGLLSTRSSGWAPPLACSFWALIWGPWLCASSLYRQIPGLPGTWTMCTPFFFSPFFLGQ